MLNNLMPDDDHCFASVGFVCSHLQITPGQLVVLMEAADVRFVHALDGVGFFNGPGFEAVAAKAREVLAEIADATEKCKAAQNN